MQIRMTIHLDEQLLADAVHLSGERSRARAVRKAIEEYVRRERGERLEKLRALSGKIDLELDDWREFRNRERA